MSDEPSRRGQSDYEVTKQEAFADFWEIIAQGVADLHERGELPLIAEPLAEAA
jgi:hypothetical protein